MARNSSGLGLNAMLSTSTLGVSLDGLGALNRCCFWCVFEGKHSQVWGAVCSACCSSSSVWPESRMLTKQ